MINIILEGENKTGKTTLANKLVNEFGYKYVKCSQPKGDPYIEYKSKINKVKENTVFDRMMYGELVYGPIYRGKSKLTIKKLRELEKIANKKNTIIIYCYDEIKNIKKRFKKEKEEFANEDKIEDTLKLYEKVLLNTKLPVYLHQIGTENDLTKKDRLSELLFNHINQYGRN